MKRETTPKDCESVRSKDGRGGKEIRNERAEVVGRREENGGDEMA